LGTNVAKGYPVFFDETWFHAPVAEGAATAMLPADELHHARVLRIRPGAEIVVTTGEGSVYSATLRDDKGTLDILGRLRHDPVPPGTSVGLPLLKGRDTEQPGEAICEFDVRDLFLLKTDHCETFKGQDHTKLVERLQAKSLTALKQAKKSWLTRIHPPQDLRTWRTAHATIPLAVAHPGESTVPSPPPPQLHLLTGPEGGFSDEELKWLLGGSSGEAASPGPVFRLSLGPTRLRAIHAPIAGLAALGSLVGRL
jgi:16S rRNA (uracil1498-N3)-methyltransferase